MKRKLLQRPMNLLQQKRNSQTQNLKNNHLNLFLSPNLNLNLPQLLEIYW